MWSASGLQMGGEPSLDNIILESENEERCEPEVLQCGETRKTEEDTMYCSR